MIYLKNIAIRGTVRNRLIAIKEAHPNRVASFYIMYFSCFSIIKEYSFNDY